MFRRLLIANRGEVAARVLRTCRERGITAVAVATPPDAELQWLAEADEVVALPDKRSYLDQDALIAAATEARCSAVHPGWGFLSENPTFAARCEAARLAFVGPRSPAMRRMADKAQARDTMRGLGLPPIPGGEGTLASLQEARRLAAEMGYPVLLKAVAGGGGRGMRKVFAEDGLADAWQSASAEASSAFGDGRLYLEKLVVNGRHIEVQVVGDGRGEVLVLGERECSVQRRHQKLVEETPSPAVSEAVRSEVFEQVRRAVGALRYRGAGTIEMLRDQDGRLWFMEMNTRLQVEHTITEEVTGLDLVGLQLDVAANRGLPEVLPAAPGGHSIECRINAEDPGLDFRPSPGLVTRLRLPEGPGVRVDTHLREGDRISPHYDSMVAKLITWGRDRAEALDRMVAALEGFEIAGVPTTIPLHLAVLRHPEFRAGAYDTGWLERSGILDELAPAEETSP